MRHVFISHPSRLAAGSLPRRNPRRRLSTGLDLAKACRRVLVLAVLWQIASSSAKAQWLTQSFDLVAGWNAVYLHVDASHAVLDDLMAEPAAAPILEVWQWNPDVPAAQFTQSPAVPAATGSPWSSWVRGQGPDAVLKRLTGNAAYLVRVDAGTPTLRWQVKGRPVAPRYLWTTTGLNFLGFPTPPETPPSFEDFLRHAPALMNNLELFRYPGGPMGPGNPVRVFALNLPVRRGEAFWLRAGDYYNRYFGPFALELPPGRTLDFGDASSASSLRLRNLTAQELVVTLSLVASEAPPPGQPALLGPPPVLIRGERNLTDLTYSHFDLSTPRSWTLKPAGQPGSEVEIVLGVNRSLMSGQPGDRYAAVLRLTDSLGLTRVDLPVSAEVTSRAGLWVGAAAVTQVRHYLTQYQKGGDGKPVLGTNGQYQVESVKNDLGNVGRPYPLRLILHTGADGGQARLLQRVYVGPKPDQTVGLVTREELLDPAQLAHARRISAVHLPWSANPVPWAGTGALRAGSNVTVVVNLSYDDPANPFLHTYHPDHDNLNATFDRRLDRGEESYDVRREITLSPRAPANDFDSLTRGHHTLTGDYAEIITLTGRTKPGKPQPDRRTFEVRGTFELTRISDIAELTTN
jgi:hypothetical protein